MSAHGTYRALSPELFVGAYKVDALGALEGALSAHLERSAALLADTHARRSALIEGEAVCHAGLMFRYGHGFQAGDPLLAVDAEARVGYPSRVAQHEADRALIEALHLGPTEAVPKKLDTLALSERGDILLVEVKDEAGDIRRAVTQAAAHVLRFRALLDRGLGETLGRMLAQRRRAGLLPERGPELRSTPKVIPWVAAPDRHDGWATRWSDETAELRHRWRELLGDLRWVRLTDQGDVIEVKRP